jgi:hypothetical protein
MLEDRIDVLRQFGGILPYNEAFYLTFLRSHIERSLDSYRWFYVFAIRNQQEDALMELAEAIRQAGIVGHYFWPGGKNKKPQHTMRAEKLRHAFNVEENSPLLEFELRNRLEHLDERLDNYFLDETFGAVLPFCLTDEDFTEVDFAKGHIFLAANPKTKKAFVLNEVFEFGPLFLELNRLLPVVDKAYELGGRLPRNEVN